MKKKRPNLEVKKSLYISLLLVLAFFLIITTFLVNLTINPLAIAEHEKSFNLEVEISESYKSMQAGDDVWFTTKILNLANEERIDIILEYSISDPNNNTLVKKSETVAIETQASFVGSLSIPKETSNGDYDLNVKLFINEIPEAQGKDSFKIRKKQNKYFYYVTYTFIILIALLLLTYIIIKSKIILGKMKMKMKIHHIIKDKSNKNL